RGRCVSCLDLSYEPCLGDLEKNVLDAHSSVERAVTGGSAHPLPTLFLEDPDLRSARLAFDHRHDFRVGDKWRAGEHFAAVLFDQKDLVVGQLGAWLSRRSVDGGD